MNDTNDGIFNAIAALNDRCEENVEAYDSVRKSFGSAGLWNDYRSFSGPQDYSRVPHSPTSNMTVRPEYNQADYNYYRPGETSPETAKGQMAISLRAYERVPIVRNVMDMMADFTVEGMRIVHRDRNKAAFLKKWAEKVMMHHVSERIAHMLYTVGTAPVRVLEGKLPLRIERDWSKSTAFEEINVRDQKFQSRVIPLGYKMLNPLTLEVIGGDIATFVGHPVYGLKISQKLMLDMQKLEQLAITSESFKDILQRVPDNLRLAVKGRHQIVALDQKKLEVLFYKKDDWRTWPVPILASIFDSLAQLEKLHLADSSALDGAISQIRLWRLGIYNDSNPAHSILPKSAAINKLRNILSNMGLGVLDLVWGPELDFKESSSQVYKYLGSEKYHQVMSEIHAGLGVPQALTGQAARGGGNAGFTNNAISMKTLIERLEYGRRILAGFWNKEFLKIQKAMKWKYPAKIMFDRTVLADEAAEKKVIMDLWDREIISNQTVLELCRRDPELEIIRVQSEARKRKNKRMPEKASPYHSPQGELELKKLVLQGGGVAPSEVGLELEERKEGEVTNLEKQGQLQVELAEKNNQAKIAQQKAKPKSAGGDGRPKTSKDKQPRKKRQAKPKSIGSKNSFINLFSWGNEAQASLNDLLSPAYLSHVGKKNLRSLTKAEFDKFEEFKFKTFARFAPYAKINADNVYNILENAFPVDDDIIISKEVLLKHFENEHERKPTVEELRQIQSSAYALKYEYEGELEDVESED